MTRHSIKYRMAIRVDPTFGSEFGVAETYAVMGREQEAREEYAKALMFVTSEGDRVEYELQSALTWIRENNHKQVDKSLHEVARHAARRWPGQARGGGQPHHGDERARLQRRDPSPESG